MKHLLIAALIALPLSGCATVPNTVQSACNDKYMVGSQVPYEHTKVIKVDSMNLAKSSASRYMGVFCYGRVTLSDGSHNVPGYAQIYKGPGGQIMRLWKTNEVEKAQDKGIAKYGTALYAAREDAIKIQNQKRVECQMRHPGPPDLPYINANSIAGAELQREELNIDSHYQKYGPNCMRYISKSTLAPILRRIDHKFESTAHALAPIEASASTHWFILDGNNYKCLSASSYAHQTGDPYFTTPYLFREHYRDRPSYLGFKVRNFDGARFIEFKFVHHDYNDYYSSLDSCKLAARVFSKNHHNLNALR